MDHENLWSLAGGGHESILLLPIDLILWLIAAVMGPFIRVIAELPIAAVRSCIAKTHTVEAVSYWPREEHVRWRVEAEDVRQVAAEIANTLAAGRMPNPHNAKFLGFSDS